jgi:hypothetical protein
MSALVILGDTSGSVTLQAPAAAGSSVHTLPAATGTVMVSGNMPAFSAYSSGGFTMTGGAWTKIILGNEEFDTHNYFDSSTNYRFTPLVAGYYQFNAQVFQASTNSTRMLCALYKNGNQFKTGSDVVSDVYGTVVSSLIYMNGSTDYVELYCYMGGTATCTGAVSVTYLNGCMMRAA